MNSFQISLLNNGLNNIKTKNQWAFSGRKKKYSLTCSSGSVIEMGQKKTGESCLLASTNILYKVVWNKIVSRSLLD